MLLGSLIFTINMLLALFPDNCHGLDDTHMGNAELAADLAEIKTFGIVRKDKFLAAGQAVVAYGIYDKMIVEPVEIIKRVFISKKKRVF